MLKLCHKAGIIARKLIVLSVFVSILVLQPLAPTEELPEFRLGKEQARTYFKQGLVYLHNYQYNAARESFIAALAIMGDFKLARKYLSDANYLSGEWQESLSELEIIEASGKMNQIWKNRAEILRLHIAGVGKNDNLTFYKHLSGDENRGYRFRNPTDILFDEEGNLFVLAFDTANIIKMDTNGFPVGNYKGSFGRTFEGPMFFTYHKGNLYVSDFASDRIYVLNDKGYFQERFAGKGSEGGKFYGPTGIAVSEKDILFVADSGNNRIQKLSLNGKFISEFGHDGRGKLKMPSGLTIEDNLVYVADKGNKRIAVFDDEGNFIKEFTHPNMTVPRSVKFYKKRMYVADEQNGLMIYNLDSEKWTKIASFRDESGKYVKLLRSFASSYDTTGSLYSIDYDRHRVDVFAPKNTLTSNLNVYIERVELGRFPDVSLFVRVRNRSKQDLTGISRSGFRVTENENVYPLVGLAKMKQFNENVSVALIYENSKKMSEFSKNIDSVLGSFFNSITVKDKIEVIRAGKDAEKIYSFGYSPLDVYAKIRKSEPTESNINFGKSLYQGIGDLVPELGPRAVVLLVSGEVMPSAFNQYTVLRNIQYANAHGIPVIILSLSDEGEMASVYKDIANRTGGIFLKIPGSPEETNLYKFIKSKQDKRYIVSYKSKLNPDLAGRYIDVEVSSFYRDVVGRAQSGFFVPEKQ
ncbi:MAG: 6-bladed beta-propeller [Leptospiraceae bacterium]|nr:6-bladed beta-propeller [Leptospiraceae bacterium]MBK7053616.1 6-bladed beta-propeller [Leptospiraceae bacterium]MBK9500259.1 6-bladed beta-propeller [Leptospiraceae bacterium]MBP9161695.1 6-bladed beta-propeller [Leptospiraceae bacterium]